MHREVPLRKVACEVAGSPMERAGPFELSHSSCVGEQLGMEMYARWGHKALWHDYLPGLLTTERGKTW